LGFRVNGSGFRVNGSGFRVNGFGFGVWGLGFGEGLAHLSVAPPSDPAPKRLNTWPPVGCSSINLIGFRFRV
jgi:hypothetical protein